MDYTNRTSINFDIRLFVYGVVLLLCFVLASSPYRDSYYTQFWILTILVLVHNLVELGLLYKRNSDHFFIQPVVLGSIILFILQSGGLTNFLMIGGDGEFSLLYNRNLVRDPVWLPYTMSLVLGSSVMYWLGYHLAIGRKLYYVYQTAYKPFLNFRVAKAGLIFGWIIGCVIKLVLNSLGAIGHKYIILILTNREIPELASRLKVFENMSLLFLMMIYFVWYQEKRKGALFLVVLLGGLFEFIFAITSGARGSIVVLFLSFFVVDYYFKNRIKFIWVVLFSGVLFFAMTLVAKYKDYVFQVQTEAIAVQNPLKSIELAILYNDSKRLTKEQKKKLNETARISTIARFNYVNEIAQMVQLKNRSGLNELAPDFITPWFTFPVFAVLPKHYIFGIEDPGYGYWVTRYLTGGKRTSTAISPIGFSYLTGGTFLVFMVFGFLGVLMKAASFLLKNVNTVIGFILFIAIMQVLAMFDTIVYATFINLIRYGLLLPPVLYMVLKR